MATRRVVCQLKVYLCLPVMMGFEVCFGMLSSVTRPLLSIDGHPIEIENYRPVIANLEFLGNQQRS